MPQELLWKESTSDFLRQILIATHVLGMHLDNKHAMPIGALLVLFQCPRFLFRSISMAGPRAPNLPV